MTRHLPLEAVENFRDFGDYPARSGKRLKRGRLYRSAAHHRATDADLEAMDALGITVIVDLRRPGERERDVSRRAPSFRGVVIENNEGENVADDPWWAFIKASDLSAEAFRGYMMNYYRAAPFVPRHVDLYSRYFRAIAEAEGPILIHCSAGKDRTGLLAALTHHVLGVSDEDILADYMLTNNAERLATRGPLVAEMIRAETGRAPTDAAVHAAIGVEAEYLAEGVKTILERYGSLDAYLEQVLGVDAELRAAIEARLLE